MGIQNRDYYRDDGPLDYGQPRGGAGGWSAVTWMIVITAGVYLLQMAGGDAFEQRFAMVTGAVRRGAVWQLLTYAFLHDRFSIWHIALNMYMLYMVGRDFEARRGSAEFIAFYLAAALASGISVFAWSVLLGQNNTVAVGASGAVCALVIVYAMIYPEQVWYIWGVLPLKVKWIALIMILLDSLPMLQQLRDRGFSDSIAHSAHLGGILFGALYQWRSWRFVGGKSTRSQSTRRSLFGGGPQLKVHRPPEPEPDFDRRVDQLLDKVAREGEASLSPEERAVLVEASRRARDRRSC